ncbi:hypothetical protein [Paenibacillus sp. CF384]|uniref:hypothetical protein n=1 Tax=Paenibacillus sp. CF384 TaxID=1884382 RepID=UPI000897E253|nr:hypothetical protein [Paenibacillus sp. CF384]SDX28156.1 hypothetical protein SAMN05518855_1011142 [Paenibacillus sp. CF384]
MVKSPVATLFLGFLPGIGHMKVGRFGRGFLYLLGVICCFLFAFIAGAGANEEGFMVLFLFLAFLIWAISILDLIIYLIRHSGAREIHLPAPVPGHLAYGPQPMSMETMTSGTPYTTSGGGPYTATSGMTYTASGASHQELNGQSSERFYTILLSFIPGLGHLQLGLMQRGLNLMIGFFGLLAMIIFVAVLADQPGFLTFLLVLPIVWLFGMFDAIRHVGLKQAGETLQDRSILDDWEDHRQGGKRSRWLSTVLSILPGAGHMYLGLQKRGLQLMAGFLLSIYLLDVLQLSLFLFMVPLLWCFSFFDALQQQSRLNNGDGQLEDVPIVDWLIHRQKWLGIALVALGLYYSADRLLLEYVQRVWGDWQLTSNIRYYFKTGLTALLLIGAGVKLLSGSKQKAVKPE